MNQPLHGRTWVFGDNLNTDVLHPPQFYSLDPERVKVGLFKGVDETLQERLLPGDLVVAGRNFGCGSSRETSIRSVKLNGIAAIIAVDFARIFFRNATNHGVPCFLFEDDTSPRAFRSGALGRLDPEACVLENDAGDRARLAPVGRFVRRIWDAGGLLGLLTTEGVTT